MSNKIDRINKRLEKNEDERKALLLKLKKEKEAALIEIGNIIVKYVPYDKLDVSLLEQVIAEYYLPLLYIEQENENAKQEKKEE